MDRQVSVHRPVAESEIRDLTRILESSSLDDLPPISSRTVRVFLSSTFSDMIQERNALMERVYPKLKTHCRERHCLEFQMMDLRWGIRDESQNDHTTIDFCLKAIENCKAHSAGPSFVAFLGQKYGYRPFPPNIKEGEFETIYQALKHDGKDVNDLDLWYKKDTNIMPPMYNLQPISSVLTDFTSKNTKLQEAARQKWDETASKLLVMLRHGAELCLQSTTLDQRVRDKYFVSVTEYEIYHGLFNSPNPETFALAFYRDITNLDEHLDTRRGRKFVDIDPKTGELDQEARHLLTKLKSIKLPKALEKRPSSMCQLSLNWQNPSMQDPSEDPDYLEKFCNKFLTMMVRLIDKAAQRAANRMNQDPYVVEVLEHLKMCKMRVDVFRGREDIIQRIHDYMQSDARVPMVLHGVSGSGKTSIIAKAASLVQQWLPDCKPVKVLRFLGTTARSTSVRLVLGCMCWQIDTGYGRQDSDIPVDYPGLVNYFSDILKLASAEKPLIILLDSLDQIPALESSASGGGGHGSRDMPPRQESAERLASAEKPMVILLDSLDQLSRTHNAHDLNWLPKQLPPHCYLVVSTLTYEYDILETLKTSVSCRKYFTEISPLGSQAGEVIIKDWLKGSGRSLTPTQYDVVHTALLKCSLPLYARLVYDKVCTWKSYDLPNTTQLEYTVKGVISKLFDRVEKYHGVTFVKHILSYLTASRNGLSDTEIEDVLSLDDEVLNDVFTYWLPPVRRIPPLLWPRLQNELGSYIMQRESNGVIVYFWYHRQFCKVVEERYLSSPDHVIYTHTMLAHYYMGTWGNGKKKAFKYTAAQAKELGLSKTESEADRMVPLQPLQFSANPSQPKRLRYNIRKLSELPFHLVKCRQSNTLKQEVLFNYTWLITKLRAMSLHDVLSDFRFATDSGFKDLDIQILSNCLRISGGNIRQRPEVLGFELAGRLLPYFSQYPYIKSFIHQCDTLALNDSAFLPLFQCFEAPRGMLNYILEDHTQNVLDLLFSHSTKQLVSLSKDCTIAFWDLRTGEQTCVIDLSESPPEASAKLFQSKDGRYLSYDSFAINSPVYVYEMRTGQLLHRVGRRTNTQRRCWSEGNLLVRQKNIINVKQGKIIKTLDDFIDTKKYLTCGIPPNEEFIMLGEEDKTSMFDLQTGELLTTFPGSNMPSMFSITPDSRRCYVGYSVSCEFKVLDVDRQSKSFSQVLLKYDYLKAFPDLRFVEPSMYSNELSSIAFSPSDDSKVVINIKRAQLILLDVKKCQSKLLDRSKVVAANRTFVSHARFSCDGKFVISAEGHMMHIWESNMENPKLIASVAIHSIDRFPLTMNNDRNLVATGSTLHTAIKVWDLDKIYTCSGAQIKVYENPVEMISCASTHRLAFVKIYHGLAAKVGYKFIDHFGVDVWNMSSGRNVSCLPMGKYGQLIDMVVSPDGQHMALLIHNRDEAYVAVANFRLGKIAQTFVHCGAVSMAISPRWDFLATEAVVGGQHCIKLWSMKASGGGSEIDTFMWAQMPVFTLDGENMLYSLNHNCVEVFSLKKMCGVNSIICDADKLDIIPTTPQMVMVTTLVQRESNGGGGEGGQPGTMYGRSREDGQPSVSIWDITAGLMISQFSHAAPRGMKDISKDGRICIDGYLQVFEIKSGRLLVDLNAGKPMKDELDQVCLTYDGQYALWVDGLTLRAGRVKDGQLIGCLCTHEIVVSLRLLDFGYIVLIGLVDGHMIATKLVDGTNKIGDGFEPLDLKSRTNWLVEKMIYPDGIIATFDAHYQCRPVRLLDNALLPHFTKDMLSTLEDKARIPHAVIKTSSFDNLRELEKEKKRRGSSPIAHLFEGRRSKETSPVSSVTNSPATLPRRKKYHKSQSTGEVLGGSAPRGPRGGCDSHERSPSLHDIFSTQKVLQNTGSMLMALTDMTPVAKFFKRKSTESSQAAMNSPLPARRFDLDVASGTATEVQRNSSTTDEEENNNHASPEDRLRRSVTTDSDYRREVGRSRFYSSSDLQEVSRL